MARPPVVGTPGTAESECGWQEFFSHPHFLRFSSAILEFVRALGRFDGMAYDIDSRRMILLARRRTDRPG
jgi:hypothetical protein